MYNLHVMFQVISVAQTFVAQFASGCAQVHGEMRGQIGDAIKNFVTHRAGGLASVQRKMPNAWAFAHKYALARAAFEFALMLNDTKGSRQAWHGPSFPVQEFCKQLIERFL